MKFGDTLYAVRDGWSRETDSLSIHSATVKAVSDRLVQFTESSIATHHRRRVPREEVDATMSLEERGAWLKFGAKLQKHIDDLERKLVTLRQQQEVCAARATANGGK